MNIAICDICNTMYCPELPEDQAHHQRIHQLLTDGVPSAYPFSQQLPAPTPGDHIAIVAHNRAPLAEKGLADAVAWAAKQSLARKATFNWYRYIATEPIRADLDYHLLLYLRNSNAIGLLAFCRRPFAREMQWGVSTARTFIDNPYWCIQMVWTAHNWQRTGIAQTLVQSAATYLGMPDARAFAWAAPFTDGGAALVKKFCPVRFLIA